MGYFVGPPAPHDLLIVLSKDNRKIIVNQGKFYRDFKDYDGLKISTFTPVGFLASTKIWSAIIEDYANLGESIEAKDLRELYAAGTDLDFGLVARAYHFGLWDLDYKHCHRCGGALGWHKTEAAKQCPSCNHLEYPRINPCVIMIVKNGSKIILAKGVGSTKNFWSLLAGYVEAGETLENAVRREVFEEVGIRLNKVTYQGSQPWPFSQSIMAGFIAETDETELKIDPAEIGEARWFEINELPELAPRPSMIWYLLEALDRYWTADNK